MSRCFADFFKPKLSLMPALLLFSVRINEVIFHETKRTISQEDSHEKTPVKLFFYL